MIFEAGECVIEEHRLDWQKFGNQNDGDEMVYFGLFVLYAGFALIVIESVLRGRDESQFCGDSEESHGDVNHS